MQAISNSAAAKLAAQSGSDARWARQGLWLKVDLESIEILSPIRPATAGSAEILTARPSCAPKSMPASARDYWDQGRSDLIGAWPNRVLAIH
jgi:hypothetical protein